MVCHLSITKKMYFSGKVILNMNLLYLLAVNSLKNFPILYYLQDPLHSIRNEYGPHVQLLQQNVAILEWWWIAKSNFGKSTVHSKLNVDEYKGFLKEWLPHARERFPDWVIQFQRTVIPLTMQNRLKTLLWDVTILKWWSGQLIHQTWIKTRMIN